MIKVVPKTVDCLCGRRLEYDYEDIQVKDESYEVYSDVYESSRILYITCPVCYREIRIK